MAIEFHCPHCDKYLKTKDDKAGRTADCPGCGEKINVPDVSDFQYLDSEEDFGGEVDYGEVDVLQRDTKSCPMCGAEIKAAAVKCRHCGEEFGPQPGGAGEFRPTVIDIGDVMGTAWEAYKANFGICFGVGLLVFIISLITSGPSTVMDIMIESGELDRSFKVVSTLLSLAANIFGIWLTLGHSIFMLKIMRGQDAAVGDIFTGAPFFLRGLGAAIVFGLVFILGFIACVIPGIYVALMWWPFLLVIVDRDEGAMASLSIAKEITTGNKMLTIVLFLVAFFLYIAGLLALCIGVLFVIPYTSLMWCTAYLRMTGQSTAV